MAGATLELCGCCCAMGQHIMTQLEKGLHWRVWSRADGLQHRGQRLNIKLTA